MFVRSSKLDTLPFCALNAPLSQTLVLQECVCRRFGVDGEGREVVYDDVVDALAITAPITNIQQVCTQPHTLTDLPDQDFSCSTFGLGV